MWCARSRPARSIWSTPTGQRCWRCRRSRRTVGWSNQIRLGRDYYVRVDSNDYSVDPAAIGRQVTVTADLERVRVRLDGRVVADHARVWARHMTVTDPAHVGIATAAARAVRPSPNASTTTRWSRDLADYDRAFGLIDGRGRVMAAKQQATVGRGQADPLPRRRAEGATDHRGRRPARRPGPRRRLDP